MVDRFQSSFGQILAIQHSQLTEKDRLTQWQKIKSGKKECNRRRSAILLLCQFGLIIVDEEHEVLKNRIVSSLSEGFIC